MADEKDKPKSMVLWDDNYGWVVYAGIRDNGDVEICSDGTHEWYAIVPASDVEHLKSALAAVAPGNKSESVLPLLLDVFGRAPEAKNPFDDIKQFLDKHSIPWKHDFWFVDRQTRAVLESAHRQYVAAGGKPVTNEQPEADPRFPVAGTTHHDKDHGEFTYKYYIFENFMPLRVSVTQDGGLFHIEIPDKEAGKFVTAMRYLSKFSDNYADLEEVDANRFQKFISDRRKSSNERGGR